MHRVHKFIAEAREEALKLMEKNIRALHPKELDLIVALCDAHNEVCEMVKLSGMIKNTECLEKYIHNTDPHIYHDTDLHIASKTMNETQWLLNRVESELNASKMYYDKWLDTKEHHYKTVSKDELRHAEGFINLARQKITHQEDKEKLQSYVEQYNILNKDLI